MLFEYWGWSRETQEYVLAAAGSCPFDDPETGKFLELWRAVTNDIDAEDAVEERREG